MSWNDTPLYNKIEYYAQIIFVALCPSSPTIAFDEEIGISRHDLIGSIIRERFNWSNIFGTQCKLVENKESITDSNYKTRTLIFELKMPNAIVKTPYNGNTSLINYEIRK